MNFTVIWLHRVLARLAANYLAARRQGQGAAITRAMARIDQLLEHDPSQQGESRTGSTRVLVERPLTVNFEIHEDERIVVITGVRYAPPRRP